MTNVMMMLGFYPFMLDTAAYQKLERLSEYRWAQMDRIGRKSAQQFIGEGADTITLHGQILPHWKGGTTQLDLMRAQAKQGRPFLMISGSGRVLGDWIIQKIKGTDTEVLADGTPEVIDFSMTLKEYGEDQRDISDLALGIAAVSTLARLL